MTRFPNHGSCKEDCKPANASLHRTRCRSLSERGVWRYLLKPRKSLFHERESLGRICRKDCQFISEQSIYNYCDIHDHLVRLIEPTESHRAIVTSLTEKRHSMLNNE